ncbi:MAG TPA: FecR domain-containing protein [Polyangiaceae bacterium]
MTSVSCPRLFEAEAVRDGRLTGAERASFERHVTTCPACAREVEALEGLAEALRARSHGAADDLHVRRERTRLLAAFDRALVVPPRGRFPRRRLASAFAVAAVGVGLLVLWRVRSPRVPELASGAVVHADPTSVWSDRRDGQRERVRLERGSLWIHVDHAAGDGRLVVELPDGELEDTGTTFAVRAENEHTTRVAVEEGRVVLRLRGRPPIDLGPGDTWVPDVPALPAPASAAQVTGPPPSTQTPPIAPRAPAAASSAADGSIDFRAAMDALDRGDNREAATRFGSFVARRPRDPRAEDAAYLHVIALQRCGDLAATKEAAAEYLRRYPGGFRQAEVERLSR